MISKTFARTMVCISLVVAAAPSFAAHVVDKNNGTLHAQENFGGGALVVSVGNFDSTVTYHNVSFIVRKCTDISGQNCVPIRKVMGDIPPGKTDRIQVAAPPGSCYFATIFVNGQDAIDFPGYCVGP